MIDERLNALLTCLLPVDRCRLLMLLVAAGIAIRSTQTSEPLTGLLGLWLLLAAIAWPRPSSAEPASCNDDNPAYDISDNRLGIRPISVQLKALSTTSDPLLRSLVDLKLLDVRREVDALVAGNIDFRDTEGWRAAYAELLLSTDVTEYRSVAWVINEDYWRDLPGEHSMKVNFQAIDRGVRIERTCILGWNLWPPELALPLPNVLQWINDQYFRGIEILLVRETELVAEPDLLRDFGIYGQRATGEQRLDSQSRTVAFTLSFDPAAVRLAQERWQRLKLFARNYQQLVDRAGTPI